MYFKINLMKVENTRSLKKNKNFIGWDINEIQLILLNFFSMSKNVLSCFIQSYLNPKSYSLVKSLNHFVRNQEWNYKKPQEIIRNPIKSSQSRLQSLISNLYEQGLKSHRNRMKILTSWSWNQPEQSMMS